MNLYLAESGGVWGAYFKDEAEIFKGANILQSFYYCNEFSERVIIPNCKRFILDSGAFTFFSTGGNVDWNEYIKRYANFINKNKVDLFFELDIDCLIGYDKVLQYRDMLEGLTGKQSIPVWHFSRGKEEFIKMCKQYDYVAFGGLNTDGIPRAKIVKYMPWFIDTAHKYGAKIHGLGFTSLKELPKLHFDSVDSTAWVSGNRFGSVYKFNGKTMENYDKKAGQRLANTRAVAIHNFKEWVKFANYAETHF